MTQQISGYEFQCRLKSLLVLTVALFSLIGVEAVEHVQVLESQLSEGILWHKGGYGVEHPQVVSLDLRGQFNGLVEQSRLLSVRDDGGSVAGDLLVPKDVAEPVHLLLHGHLDFVGIFLRISDQVGVDVVLELIEYPRSLAHAKDSDG